MSFTAIHKETKEFWDVQNVIGNLRFPEPDKEEWLIDPNCVESGYDEAVKLYGEIKTVLVKGTEFINFNGSTVFRPPHFRCHNASKYGLNIKAETKEHKQAKQFIFQYLKNPESKLMFKYAEKSKPYNYNNIITLKELDINHSMIGIENRDKDNFGTKIADIYLPFNKKNDFFGDGIYFEIQFSNQRTLTTQKRTIERLSKYSSVVWLYQEDFNEDYTQLVNPEVKIEAWGSGFKKIKSETIKELKYEVKKIVRLLEQEKDSFIEEVSEFYPLLSKYKLIEEKIGLRQKQISELKEQIQNSKNVVDFINIKNENINELNEIAAVNNQNFINQLQNEGSKTYNYFKNLIGDLKIPPKPLDCSCGGQLIYKEWKAQSGKHCQAYKCAMCQDLRWV